jgi:hypothetical protein
MLSKSTMNKIKLALIFFRDYKCNPFSNNRYLYSEKYSNCPMMEIDRFHIIQSNSQGWCYVHIPKCGGTSIKKVLGVELNGHPILSEMLAQGLKKDLEVFTLCRNPYHRLVSAYEYMKKWGEFNRYFYELVLFQYPTFESFVLGWLTVENCQKWPHFVPQFEFINTKYNEVNIVFVKLERIDVEWSKVESITGVSNHMRHDNSTGEKTYSEYYVNPVVEQKVFEIYKKDFLIFGYSRNEGV